MRVRTVLFLIMSVMPASPVFAKDQVTRAPLLVLVEPEKILVPPCADVREKTRVVLSGWLSGPCRFPGPVLHRLGVNGHTLFIRAQAYLVPGCGHPEALSAYTESLDLGWLRAGAYELVVEQLDGMFKLMSRLTVVDECSEVPEKLININD